MKKRKLIIPLFRYPVIRVMCVLVLLTTRILYTYAQDTFTLKNTEEIKEVTQIDVSEAKTNTGENYALLHVYRLGGYGDILGYDLYVDEIVYRVEYKQKETIKIYKEGKITLLARAVVKKELPIDIEFGKEYYIRCSVRNRAVTGIYPTLELVDETIGKKEFDKIKWKK